ncbi:MAG: RNA 2',3'-cyclic phosphodiesterase [Anaerolineales bacterium]|nr:RNA 2',3'-cyclic phosphodiesterase [Anaerolineales bacterium]
MTTIRTFIAVELPDNARQIITQLQSRLKGLAPPHTVRWTASQNIHLTLHFLGDIQSDELDQINNALQTSTQTAQSFSLTLGELGCFPNMRRPRILWVGVHGETQPLIALHRRLGVALQTAINFTPESRPYAPHLTIGRVNSGGPARHIPQLSQMLATEQAVGRLVTFEVDHISLIKSELKPTGSIYTPLTRVSLNPRS